ncbi:hypothetical protein [Salinibacter grassmerensis]|uniref:hypothetical protein n=1 Tax=Salinibacter grassmerensis TaxID=3040353 RepID=UPI0021E7F3CD|nr:hypothetical protein [Salinibacter grassmerensis]
MSENGVHATNIGLVTARIGLGAGAYTGLLLVRVGVSPMFNLEPVALHYAAAWWVPYAPSFLNMPNQAAYDALPGED